MPRDKRLIKSSPHASVSYGFEYLKSTMSNHRNQPQSHYGSNYVSLKRP